MLLPPNFQPALYPDRFLCTLDVNSSTTIGDLLTALRIAGFGEGLTLHREGLTDALLDVSQSMGDLGVQHNDAFWTSRA